MQCALPAWLEGRGTIQSQIKERLRRNLVALDRELAYSAISSLELEAGWYATLRVPAIEMGEELAVRLVRDFGVEVHPGHFFGFPDSGWLVVSLLTPEPAFAVGIKAIRLAFN